MNGKPIEAGDVIKKGGVNYVFIESFGFDKCRVIDTNGMITLIDNPISLVKRFKKRNSSKLLK